MSGLALQYVKCRMRTGFMHRVSNPSTSLSHKRHAIQIQLEQFNLDHFGL